MLPFLTTLALAAPALAIPSSTGLEVPSLQVPSCPNIGTASFALSVPDKKPFPKTSIDACYTSTSLVLAFRAFEEQSFHYNSSQGTNDAIWEYEVMEAFIAPGEDDPQTYLEIEVNPGNVTYNAFVFNPSKERSPGAPFDHAFLEDPIGDGLVSETVLDREKGVWVSEFKVPLGLWNIDEGKAKGTKWRMNFFRTVTDPETWPEQGLGAWGVPDKASFHISKFFGKVEFV